MVSVLQQGLESVRAVKAFDRQDLEESHLKDVSMSTVQASLNARKVKSLLSPVVALDRCRMYGFCSLARCTSGTYRSDDPGGTDSISFLSRKIF